MSLGVSQQDPGSLFTRRQHTSQVLRGHISQSYSAWSHSTTGVNAAKRLIGLDFNPPHHSAATLQHCGQSFLKQFYFLCLHVLLLSAVIIYWAFWWSSWNVEMKNYKYLNRRCICAVLFMPATSLFLTILICIMFKWSLNEKIVTLYYAWFRVRESEAQRPGMVTPLHIHT